MTRLRISAEQIAELGRSLGDVADYLEVRAAYTRDAVADDYGFVGVTAEGALHSVLGDYELQRVALCERLRSLDDLARRAGGCYLDTELLVERSVTPVHIGGRPRGLR